MKKICLFFIAFSMMSILKSNAQSTFANNTYGAARFLGWGTSSGDLWFKTNNTTRMTLKDNTGFFGVGVAAPGYFLEVQDDISIIPNGSGQAYYRIWGSPGIIRFGSTTQCYFW